LLQGLIQAGGRRRIGCFDGFVGDVQRPLPSPDSFAPHALVRSNRVTPPPFRRLEAAPCLMRRADNCDGHGLNFKTFGQEDEIFIKKCSG
jgi:hypothetical protein